MSHEPLRVVVRCVLLAALATSLSPIVRAQCPEWSTGFGPPGVDGKVLVVGVHDDGTGPAFHIGGRFSQVGATPASNVARWNGSAWEPLGAGVSGQASDVRALVTFDEGSGPRLFAAGSFLSAGGVPVSRIARWNGSTWSDVGGGTDGTVEALQVHDDGTGPALYALGDFTQAGGVAAQRVARWNGGSRSAVGAGLPLDVAHDLAVFDDGMGSGLYACGLDGTWGSVHRWDGASWSMLGSNLSHSVLVLDVYDDGTGPALYAGGVFQGFLARWSGSAWTTLGGGVDDSVTALAVHDDGTGPALFAGGEFRTADGLPARHVARWDGSSWSALGGGVDGSFPFSVDALGSLPTATGDVLAVGGDLETAGGIVASGLAGWLGGQWRALAEGRGVDSYGTTTVSALTTIDDGSGPVLYAGGDFTTAGDTQALRVARWDGGGWSALGAGIEGVAVHALAGYHDGTELVLYAGGQFDMAGGQHASRVARWDGTSWSPLGSGVFSSVRALEVFDSGTGPEVFVAGRIQTAGSMPAPGVARWDGRQWLPASFAGSDGRAFAVHDDGSGPALFVAGDFTGSQVQRWDGASWSPLPPVPTQVVTALASFDDGSGPALYAGARAVGGIGSMYRLQGSVWATVTAGFDAQIRALHVFDDGSGPALYAGGDFTFIGSTAASHLARYNGAGWSPIDLGTDQPVHALASTVRGGEPTLFVGGEFLRAGGNLSLGIAAWSDPCASGPVTYCQGKPSSAGCVPFVTSTGDPSTSSPTPFRIAANDVVPSEAGFLLYGFEKASHDFHGGKLCVKVPFVRTPLRAPSPTGGTCSGWTLQRDFNTIIQSGADPRLTAGTAVFAQWRQRDPGDPAGFGDSLSDAVRFRVRP